MFKLKIKSIIPITKATIQTKTASLRKGQPKKKKEKVNLNQLNSASFYPSSHCVRSGNRAIFGKDSTGRHKVTNHFTYSLDRKSNLL